MQAAEGGKELIALVLIQMGWAGLEITRKIRDKQSFIKQNYLMLLPTLKIVPLKCFYDVTDGRIR